MTDKMRVEITIDALLANAIDDFRRRQIVIPTRAEAIRDLLEAGLEAESATA